MSWDERIAFAVVEGGLGYFTYQLDDLYPNYWWALAGSLIGELATLVCFAITVLLALALSAALAWSLHLLRVLVRIGLSSAVSHLDHKEGGGSGA